MQIHLILDPRLPPRRLAQLGALAEQHGIAGVWVSSLLGATDPFVGFVPLALATQRLRMGPIAVNPFDTHPARIATALLTLNEIAAGRTQIVIGGGAEALAGLGIKPEKRVLAVRECVELLRMASSGKRGDFDGKLYRATGFGCEWVTAPAPPIWIGANGPQMLSMAAQTADGIMVSDLPQPVLGQAIAGANKTRAAKLPSAAPLQFSNFVAWHVYEDLERARLEARRWLAYRGLNRRWVCTTFMSDSEFDLIETRMPDFYKMAHGGGDIEGVPPALLDLLIDKLTLTGQPSRLEIVLQHLDELRAAGLTQVALRLYADPEASIALIGQRVLPHVI